MSDQSTPNHEGRRSTDRHLAGLTLRVHRLESEFGELRSELKANTETTEQIRSDTGELIELLRSWQGAMRVLNGIGAVAKPLGYIGTAIAALLGLWAAIKGGSDIGPKP